MKSINTLQSNSLYFLLFIEIFFLLKIPLHVGAQNTFLNNKTYNNSITNNLILEEKFIRIMELNNGLL